MKGNFIIKYIRNGQEYTIRNKLQYFIRNKNIFANKIREHKNGVYDVLKEVELIHIKNVHFDEEINFECWNHNTIVILENCTFNSHYVKLERGCFELIDCIFDEDKTNKVEAWVCQEISIKGNKNNKINNLFIDDTEKVILDNIHIIRNLRLTSCKNVTIKNTKTTNSFALDTEEYLEIDNSKLESQNSRKYLIGKQIKIKNSIVTGESFNIDCQSLILEDDSKIETNQTIEFSSPSLKEIQIDDNSHLKGKNIQFVIHLYQNNNNEPFIINKTTLNNIWFQRKNLISILKEIKIKYSNKIDKKLEKEQKEEMKFLDENEAQKIELIKQEKVEEISKLATKIELKKKYKRKMRIKNL